jgi:hypothetical protein
MLHTIHLLVASRSFWLRNAAASIEDRVSHLPVVQQCSGIIVAERMLPVRDRSHALIRAVCQRHEFIRHTCDVSER